MLRVTLVTVGCLASADVAFLTGAKVSINGGQHRYEGSAPLLFS